MPDISISAIAKTTGQLDTSDNLCISEKRDSSLAEAEPYFPFVLLPLNQFDGRQLVEGSDFRSPWWDIIIVMLPVPFDTAGIMMLN